MEEFEAAPDLMPVKKSRRGLKIAAGVSVTLALILGGSSAAYGVYYAERALPSQQVAGKDISGLQETEVAELISKAASEKKLKLKLASGDVVASYKDLGIETDVAATVEDVFAPNKSIIERFKALFSPREVRVVTKINETKLHDYADNLEKKLSKQRVDAKVEYDAETGEFKVIPGSDGEVIDKVDFLAQVKAQAEKFTTDDVKVKINHEEPEITDEKAKSFKEKAEELSALKVAFFEGKTDIVVPAKKLASLISLTDEEGKSVEPHFVEDKVRDYVLALSAETNEESEAAIHNVNVNGELLQIASPGKPGWRVNNAEAVANAAIASLKEGKEYRGEFTYDKIPQKIDTRLIADGAENLFYQAAPGERWIDINLSNLTMTAYEGATPVFFSNQIVPGDKRTPTVVGKFAVYLKYRIQDMRGLNFDGTPYLTKGVPWVTYFHSGYAIHGAPWRSDFGIGYSYGSHGCVNTPVDHARFIYEWSQMGDPVVVHY